MPWTPAQIRMFHAWASGSDPKKKATAEKILSEHAGVRKDVDQTGHAKHTAKRVKR